MIDTLSKIKILNRYKKLQVYLILFFFRNSFFQLLEALFIEILLLNSYFQLENIISLQSYSYFMMKLLM